MNSGGNNKFKIFLRDWYYNAGIIGFLNVLSQQEKNTNNIKKNFENLLDIYDSYIEFNEKVLDKFYEKYEKVAFDVFFNINDYKERVNNLLQKVIQKNQQNEKIDKKLLKETALNGKIVNYFIKCINNGKDLNDVFSGNNILQQLQNVTNIINSFKSNTQVYTYLRTNQQNANFIVYFLDNELNRRVCSYSKISLYIKDILTKNITTSKKNDKCFICGEYKKEYDFSNAISQILGFNSDNLNWIWGYQASKAKICALCALIYTCAPLGMVFLNRKIDNEYKTFFYSLNRNPDITSLYHSYWIFKEKISQKQNQNKPFYTILQEVVVELLQQQAKAVLENINFVEIAENDFGGQSTKSYNVYNYNITEELASFIKEIGKDGIPKGYYKNGNLYSDVTEEILKKTLNYTLSFSDLANYFEIYIRSLDPKSKIILKFSIYQITNYIVKYINRIKGGTIMKEKEIINKAFHNGKIIGEKMEQENKIKSTAYQLLNALKTFDRNSFLNRYLRLSIAYGLEIKLGSHDELSDIDKFMTFGYAFLNGLLSNIKPEQQDQNNNGNNNNEQ